MKTIPCPKCKRAEMEMFGVTERGAFKYACPRCYHKHEEMKARILNPSAKATDRMLPRIDPDDLEDQKEIDQIEWTLCEECNPPEETPTLNTWLDKMMKLRMKRVVSVYDAVKRKFTT